MRLRGGKRGPVGTREVCLCYVCTTNNIYTSIILCLLADYECHSLGTACLKLFSYISLCTLPRAVCGHSYVVVNCY